MAVYFVLDEDGLIKIGTTEFVRNRTRQLDGVLVGVEQGSFHREHELHLQFADLRSSGEWFRPGKALLAYIAALPEDASLWPEPEIHGRAAQSKFLVLSKLYDGQFAEHVSRWRVAGWSWRRISREVYVTKGFDISHEAIRNWADRREGVA